MDCGTRILPGKQGLLDDPNDVLRCENPINKIIEFCYLKLYNCNYVTKKKLNKIFHIIYL